MIIFRAHNRTALFLAIIPGLAKGAGIGIDIFRADAGKGPSKALEHSGQFRIF
jgi:hypothetical protein